MGVSSKPLPCPVDVKYQKFKPCSDDYNTFFNQPDKGEDPYQQAMKVQEEMDGQMFQNQNYQNQGAHRNNTHGYQQQQQLPSLMRNFEPEVGDDQYRQFMQHLDDFGGNGPQKPQNLPDQFNRQKQLSFQQQPQQQPKNLAYYQNFEDPNNIDKFIKTETQVQFQNPSQDEMIKVQTEDDEEGRKTLTKILHDALENKMDVWKQFCEKKAPKRPFENFTRTQDGFGRKTHRQDSLGLTDNQFENDGIGSDKFPEVNRDPYYLRKQQENLEKSQSLQKQTQYDPDALATNLADLINKAVQKAAEKIDLDKKDTRVSKIQESNVISQTHQQKPKWAKDENAHNKDNDKFRPDKYYNRIESVFPNAPRPHDHRKTNMVYFFINF